MLRAQRDFRVKPGVGFDPRMLEGLLGSEPLLFFDDQVLDQVFCLVADGVPNLVVEVILAPENVLEDLFIAGACKRRVASKDDVQDDAC